jgi:hypothetical protein
MLRSSALALAIVVMSSSLASAEPDRTVVIDVGKPMRMRAGWVALGGVALVLGSAGLSLYEKHEYDAAKPRLVFDSSGRPASPDAYAAFVRMNNASWTTKYYGTGLFAAGTVALGVAGYLYARGKIVVRRTIVAPALTPDRVGVVVAHRF